MRFEAPRIHFKPAPHSIKRAPRFTRPRATFQHKPLRRSHAPVLRQPERLKPIPEIGEARPSGFDKYNRRFTAEGGIRLSYQDVERSLPVILGKLILWGMGSTFTWWAGSSWSPMEGFWWNLSALLLCMLVYGVILFRDTRVIRTVEIRPDCMILEGMDVFWKEHMPLGWPGFEPDASNNFVLKGVYGTREIEYLTIRRFDERDRAPEVFASQLAAAMQYQWELPSKGV